MKISIVTVSYNSASTIKATIESILSQTYPNIEYIIIDGNSTDGTQEIIKSYGNKINCWVSEPDLGMYDAMNKGIKRATGDIISILNSDDVYANPDTIEKVITAFSTSGIAAVYGDLVYVKRSNLSAILRHWKSGYGTRSKMYHSFWQPPHPTLFLNSEVYRKVGLFNLQYKIAADIELMVRVFYVHHFPHCYLPEILVKMRTGGASNQNFESRKRLVQEYFSIIRHHRLRLALYCIPLRLILKIMQYF